MRRFGGLERLAVAVRGVKMTLFGGGVFVFLLTDVAKTPGLRHLLAGSECVGAQLGSTAKNRPEIRHVSVDVGLRLGLFSASQGALVVLIVFLVLRSSIWHG